MSGTNLPPSSKTVLSLLDESGAMTHKEIVKKSNLAPRTVRYALKKLKENHLIMRNSTSGMHDRSFIRAGPRRWCVHERKPMQHHEM